MDNILQLMIKISIFNKTNDVLTVDAFINVRSRALLSTNQRKKDDRKWSNTRRSSVDGRNWSQY